MQVIRFPIQRFTEYVDLLRGGSVHDLLAPERRHHDLARIGWDVDVLVLAPPCDTHTRARHSLVAGPRPLRDASWPRGRPDLTEAERDKVNKANILTDFAIQALRAAAERNVLALLEFPEDIQKKQAREHQLLFGECLR